MNVFILLIVVITCSISIILLVLLYYVRQYVKTVCKTYNAVSYQQFSCLQTQICRNKYN